MALLTLGISWKTGERGLFQGASVSLPANYGNDGSSAGWRHKSSEFRKGWTPYTPNPTIKLYNELVAPQFHMVKQGSVGALSINNANVSSPVDFTPAGQSSNTVSTSNSSTAANPVTKTLL